MRRTSGGTMYHDQGWAGTKPNGGSPVGDVPRDAIETAQRMWVEATEQAGIGGIFSSTDLIARAILAERERCAKLVYDEANEHALTDGFVASVLLDVHEAITSGATEMPKEPTK